MGALGGVVMELQDCALPLIRDVVATDDPNVALKVKIFKVQGQALDQFAKKTCKILVVGNPANTNALICSHYAPSIPKENFSAMTRLDQNRAAGQIAEKLGVPIS